MYVCMYTEGERASERERERERLSLSLSLYAACRFSFGYDVCVCVCVGVVGVAGAIGAATFVGALVVAVGSAVYASVGLTLRPIPQPPAAARCTR